MTAVESSFNSQSQDAFASQDATRLGGATVSPEVDWAPPQRMQPLVAIRALRRLMADPERTDEVFNVIRALSGPSISRGLQRFSRVPAGRRVLAERRVLLTTLLDRDALSEHANGSLADRYLAFTREGNITADGLVEASEGREQFESADHQLYGERLRDQHDLWHTLMGYGRDELGEVCLLAFTYAQTRNRGIGAMALIGSYKLSGYYGRGVFGAVIRAWRDGKRAAWLPGQDWEALLDEPIEAVRERLQLVEPKSYTRLLDSAAA